MKRKRVKIDQDCDKNWANNDIQFPRLLSELAAAGVSLQPKLMDQVCESMDLRIEEVEELFERAQVVWDEIKERTCPRRK